MSSIKKDETTLDLLTLGYMNGIWIRFHSLYSSGYSKRNIVSDSMTLVLAGSYQPKWRPIGLVFHIPTGEKDHTNFSLVSYVF
jgi:hypothetical protein